ncbi:MAG TPA: ABC transporter permease subunit, partial [Acidimicrobiales bacterium]
SFPSEIRDASRLDGCGHLKFLFRIVVPINRPVIGAFGLFAFLTSWNQYLWPLVATGGSTPLYTVQLGLKQLLGTQVSEIPVSLAGAVIAFVPLVILLLIFQKQLVRSLTAGAVK